MNTGSENDNYLIIKGDIVQSQNPIEWVAVILQTFGPVFNSNQSNSIQMFFCGLGTKGLANGKMTRQKTPKPVLLS